MGVIRSGWPRQVTHLTGPDLVFVVEVLRRCADWAWIEARPKSRDVTSHSEDVTALLRKQDGRWVIQSIGSCEDAADPESGCNAR